MVIVSRDRIGSMDCSVHRLPGGGSKIHDSYGLRIISFGRGGRGMPGRTPYPRYFEFYCISHMFEGKGYFWTPKGPMADVEPGEGVLVSPGFIHCYGGGDDYYIEDTVCFWGPVADCLFNSGLFKAGVARIGSERRLLPIIERAMDPSMESQLLANVELQRLVINLHLENKLSSEELRGGKSKMAPLMDELRLSPERWWTVSEMASVCGLGEVQFRRLFRQTTGMSPKRYVEKLKMQRAIEMLSGGRESVGSIARSLAYSDPFHFSRRFKLCTGMSPAEYRESLPR